MIRLIMLALSLILGCSTYAQDETKIKVSGYLESYYGFDFNNPVDNNRPSFVHSHHRNNVSKDCRMLTRIVF